MGNKKLKDRWLGARVDEDLISLVEVFIDAAEITMGDLVRKATKEYMLNHPMEPSQLTKVTTIGPLV